MTYGKFAIATLGAAILSSTIGLALLLTTGQTASGLMFLGLSLVLLILLVVPRWEIDPLPQQQPKTRPDRTILAFIASLGIGALGTGSFIFVRARILGGLYLPFGILGSLFFLAIGVLFVTAWVFAVRAPR